MLKKKDKKTKLFGILLTEEMKRNVDEMKRSRIDVNGYILELIETLYKEFKNHVKI